MSSYNSYYSSMYERKLTIGEFTGIDQSRGACSNDYGSSPDAKNFICRDGRLYTCSGAIQYGVTAPESAYESSDGRVFQAFFRDADGNDFSKVVLALHGRFYAADMDCNSWNPIAAGFVSDDWSAVNYRDENHDWIIFANGIDDAQYWDGVSAASFPLNPTQGATDESEGEELLFSKLTLLNERLWGGVTSDYPDRIYWSNTFDAEDWEFNYVDSTNEGGGFIDVATFDGSRIRAIVSAFDDVLIFKDKSVHRLSGTYPGEFSLSQVYGAEGTLASRTIVYNGTRLYFLSCDGLCVYNGTSVASLSEVGDRKLKDIWARINPSTINKACAVMKDSVIYLAVPLDGSAINTHVIEYDTATGIYSIIDLPGVDDWLVLREGQKETLLYLDADKLYRYSVGYTFHGDPIDASWVSPEITCGSLASKKSTGRIYMTVDAQSIDISKEPALKFTMFSDKKERTKIIPLKNGVNRIRKRVKIRGRAFRFKIENVDGNPLSINRGMEIRVEEDYD